MTQPPTRFASAVVTVVLAYALFAGLWLLLSGGDVGLLLSDPLALVRARPLKDWLFVPAASLLLALLLHGLLRRLAAACESELGVERTRRQAEQSRQLADDLNATLQAIPDLMFEMDGQGRYVAVKALNQALLAAPVDELLGHTVSDVLPAAAAATVMQALDAASEVGTDFGRTVALPVADGERHFELSVARKPRVTGQGERFIVLSRDITARHLAEAELRQRNQELERFNHAAIERELRIVALKREVNRLALAAGRPAPYDTSFVDTSFADTSLADAPVSPAQP